MFKQVFNNIKFNKLHKLIPHPGLALKSLPKQKFPTKIAFTCTSVISGIIIASHNNFAYCDNFSVSIKDIKYTMKLINGDIKETIEMLDNYETNKDLNFDYVLNQVYEYSCKHGYNKL